MGDSKTLTLRKANKNDEKLLFNWVNNTCVRRWSFNNKKILLDEHKIWFKQKFDDESVLMWIFEVNTTPAGLVRLEKDNNEVLLNYLIASESRGKGLATKMLKMAMYKVRSHWKNIKVFAYTFPKNIASIKSLEKAGFYLESSSNEKNCYIFHKTEKIGAVYE